MKTLMLLLLLSTAGFSQTVTVVPLSSTDTQTLVQLENQKKDLEDKLADASAKLELAKFTIADRYTKLKNCSETYLVGGGLSITYPYLTNCSKPDFTWGYYFSKDWKFIVSKYDPYWYDRITGLVGISAGTITH